MKVLFNTDSNVTINDALNESFTQMVTDDLIKYDDQITRVEVHFSDENAGKEAQNDKRCLLEVRLAGLKPLAVTDNANSYQQALMGALDKMNNAIGNLIGRLNEN